MSSFCLPVRRRSDGPEVRRRSDNGDGGADVFLNETGSFAAGVLHIVLLAFLEFSFNSSDKCHDQVINVFSFVVDFGNVPKGFTYRSFGPVASWSSDPW